MVLSPCVSTPTYSLRISITSSMGIVTLPEQPPFPMNTIVLSNRSIFFISPEHCLYAPPSLRESASNYSTVTVGCRPC